MARPCSAAPATPVVMAGGFDPVANGLAESLSRPGRGVTGIVNLSDELAKKDFELIMELLPRARRIGVLSSNSAASEGSRRTARRRRATQHRYRCLDGR